MTLSQATKSMALEEVRRLRKQVEDYEAECRKEYDQGYRPSHCIHGTYMWRDYDVICGPCEDGWDPRLPQVMYRMAIDRAQYQWRVFGERMEVWTAARNAANEKGLRIPDDVRTVFLDWALEAVRKEQ